MKKFFALLEELWVAVAFAEAGEYDTLNKRPEPMRYESGIRIQAI